MARLQISEILEVLRQHKGELAEQYGVRSIGVFGSRVRGEETEASDVDILVEFDPESRISLLDFVRLEDYLGYLLGVPVDLVEKSALKPRVARHVLAEVLYV